MSSSPNAYVENTFLKELSLHPNLLSFLNKLEEKGVDNVMCLVIYGALKALSTSKLSSINWPGCLKFSSSSSKGIFQGILSNGNTSYIL